MANGLVLIGLQAPGGVYHETLYSSSMACPDCGINVPKLEPRSFSFNSAYGACPECHGLGSIYDFDPAKTITDWSKPLLDGAMGPGSASQYLLRLIKLAADKYKINLKRPFQELSKADQELLLYGPPTSGGGAHGLPRHHSLAARHAGGDEVRGLSRVHDAVHVRDGMSAMPRAQAAAGVARGDDSDRGCGGASAGESR